MYKMLFLFYLLSNILRIMAKLVKDLPRKIIKGKKCFGLSNWQKQFDKL